MKQFGLSSKERIKSKKEFDLVYSTGDYLLSSSKKLKAVFFIRQESEKSGIKTAFAVSRKCGTAVWRNRVKRLLRTSFRLNKQEISPLVESKGVELFIVFSPYTINQNNSRMISLVDIMPDVIELINQIKLKL